MTAAVQLLQQQPIPCFAHESHARLPPTATASPAAIKQLLNACQAVACKVLQLHVLHNRRAAVLTNHHPAGAHSRQQMSQTTQTQKMTRRAKRMASG